METTMETWTADTTMLTDTDRNSKYDKALEAMAKGKRVLDVGTGTGLLAMLAARHGASKVIACETYGPMADVAQATLERNSMNNTISLIHKDSSQLTLEDLEGKPATLVVSEIVDSELLGEGILPSIRDVMKRLASKDAICIPCRASLYIQLVRSPLLRSWVDLNDCSIMETAIFPKDVQDAIHVEYKHEVHVDRIANELEVASEPMCACTIDLMHIPDTIISRHHCHMKVAGQSAIDGVIMWWRMDLTNDISITTQPDLIDQQSESYWREHWLPLIHVLKQPLSVEPYKTNSPSVNITLCYDDYSVWIETEESQPCTSTSDKPLSVPRHNFTASPISLSRHRLSIVNNTQYKLTLCKALENVIHSCRPASVRIIGFGCINLAVLAAARMPDVEQIIACEEQYSVELMRVATRRNNACLIIGETELEVTLADMMKDNEPKATNFHFDVVVAEPYFSSCLEPWQAAIQLAKNIKAVKRWLLPSAKVFPKRITLCCVLVEFVHFHRTHQRVKEACGFDMTAFDDAVHRKGILPTVCHLWEHKHTLLCQSQEIVSFDFMEIDPKWKPTQTKHTVFADKCGTCHGVVVYVRRYLTEKVVLDEYTPEPGYCPYKQAVFLLDSPQPVKPGESLSLDIIVNPLEETVIVDIAEP